MDYSLYFNFIKHTGSYNPEKLILRLYVTTMSHSFRVNLHTIFKSNVKERLVGSRHHIWSLSNSNGIRTHNHLVRKRTLNHLVKLTSLAKLLSVRLQTTWFQFESCCCSNVKMFMNFIKALLKFSYQFILSKRTCL